MHLPIKSIPLIGDIFGQLNLLVWLALAMVLVTWVVVFRTPSGLRLRSVGENPLAAETAGLKVVRTRYVAVMISGALAALGGAFLSIGFSHSFIQNMTAGRGFIALAALIFGRWRPGTALAATLLFGFGSALAPAAGRLLAVGLGALPRAAVRADADRGHRPDRPLDTRLAIWAAHFHVSGVRIACRNVECLRHETGLARGCRPWRSRSPPAGATARRALIWSRRTRTPAPRCPDGHGDARARAQAGHQGREARHPGLGGQPASRPRDEGHPLLRGPEPGLQRRPGLDPAELPR